MNKTNRKTTIVKINRSQPDRTVIARAAALLRNRGLVAFPTETVYGLGANALDAGAVKKIFLAKQRPADNPLIVHIGFKKETGLYARNLPAAAKKLIKEFWPGPLTLILKKTGLIPDIVTCGLDTVALRMPCNPIALSLIRRAGVPVAAPSANRSGRPSPTSAQDVIEDLYGRIDFVLDGGQTQVGIESTVLDLSGNIPVILRPGKISYEQLKSVLGPVLQPARITKSGAPKSPGMKYRHYAPRARLIIVQGKEIDVMHWINRQITRTRNKTGVMTTIREHRYNGARIKYIGSTFSRIGKNLFRSLRELDREGVRIIYAESIPERGYGAAIMNRLRKAAGFKIVKV